MIVNGVKEVGTEAEVRVRGKEHVGHVVVMVREVGAVTKTVVMMHCVV